MKTVIVLDVNFFHRYFHVFETARTCRWVFSGFGMSENVYRTRLDAGHQQQRLEMAWGMVSCGILFVVVVIHDVVSKKVVWMAFLRICPVTLLSSNDTASEGTSKISG